MIYFLIQANSKIFHDDSTISQAWSLVTSLVDIYKNWYFQEIYKKWMCGWEKLIFQLIFFKLIMCSGLIYLSLLSICKKKKIFSSSFFISGLQKMDCIVYRALEKNRVPRHFRQCDFPKTTVPKCKFF